MSETTVFQCDVCSNGGKCEFESDIRKNPHSCNLYNYGSDVKEKAAEPEKEKSMFDGMSVDDIINMDGKSFIEMCEKCTVRDLEQVKAALSIGTAEMNRVYDLLIKDIVSKGNFNLVVDNKVADEFSRLVSISTIVGGIRVKMEIVSYYSYKLMPECFKHTDKQ
jgi:hypothetical protein